MAEAQASLALVDQYRRKELRPGVDRTGVEYNANQDGVSINLRLVIPTKRRLVRVFARTGYRIRNRMQDFVYPLGFPHACACWAFYAGMVVKTEDETKLPGGAMARLILYLAAYFPFYAYMNTTMRMVCVGGWTAVCTFVVLALLQRLTVRLLLNYRGWMFEHGKRVSTTTKLWGLLLHAVAYNSVKPRIYSWQRCLPAQPVPSLEHTTDKLLESIKCVENEATYHEFQALVKEFLEGPAKKLQVLVHLKRLVSANYVSDWWENVTYLRLRCSLQCNMNYYGMCSHHLATTDRCARAAGMLSELMQFKRLIDHEEMEPILIRGMIPMCMHQYVRCFSTTRVPGRESDTIVHLEPEYSTHIVVCCKGIYYRMNMFSKEGGYREAWDIEDELRAIQADASIQTVAPEALMIGNLTALQRTRWAEVRDRHFSDGVNKASLDCIESAMLCVVLDDRSPETFSERGKMMLHSEGVAGPWYDKSMTMIVFKNAHCGFNCEHSWADALVVAHLVEHVSMTGESRGKLYDDNGRCLRPKHARTNLKGVTVECLVWNVEGCQQELRDADAFAKENASKVQLIVEPFEDFGKDVISKQCKLSPDSFVQAALQLAFYRDQGHACHTYEAAMTRLFKNGRTDVVRSATAESAQFVAAMQDPRVSKETRKNLFTKAANVHQRKSLEVMCGNGIDRHMFALYVAGIGIGIDSPFLKKALTLPWKLSTSQQPMVQTKRWNMKNPKAEGLHVALGGGFGPVATDGYGVSYGFDPFNQRIGFHFSASTEATNTDVDRFQANVYRALCDCHALFK